MADVIDTGEARGLFQVYVVDYKNDFPFDPVVVVAESSEAAKLNAFRKVGYLEGVPDYYDFIVRRLGDVRAKKEVQEVRIVTNKGTFSVAAVSGGQDNVASGDTSTIAGGIENTAKV